jgi:hypothetical protein
MHSNREPKLYLDSGTSSILLLIEVDIVAGEDAGGVLVVKVKVINDLLLNVTMMAALVAALAQVRGRVVAWVALGVGIGRASGLGIKLFVLNWDQFLVQHVLDNVVPLFLLPRLKIFICLENFVAGTLILSIHNDAEFVGAKSGLYLLAWWLVVIIVITWSIDLVTVHNGGVSVLGKLIVWFPKLLLPMGVRAVLSKLALAFLDPEFAQLGLIVVVLHVHHFKN